MHEIALLSANRWQCYYSLLIYQRCGRKLSSSEFWNDNKRRCSSLNAEPLNIDKLPLYRVGQKSLSLVAWTRSRARDRFTQPRTNFFGHLCIVPDSFISHVLFCFPQICLLFVFRCLISGRIFDSCPELCSLTCQHRLSWKVGPKKWGGFGQWRQTRNKNRFLRIANLNRQ